MGKDSVSERYQTKDSVVRIIRSPILQSLLPLLEQSSLDRLVIAGLMPTTLQLNTEHATLVQKKAPYVSVGGEWIGRMLKDAALCTCDIAIELARQGYELIDAHPGNIVFNNGYPQFVDIGSFVPALSRDHWRARSQYLHCFWQPLLYYSCGKEDRARYHVMNFPISGPRIRNILTELPPLSSIKALRVILK